jgi:hypothetical protein
MCFSPWDNRCVETLTREKIEEALAGLNARLAARSCREVLDVALRYYPAERLPVRSRLLLQEMFDGRA